LITISCYLPEDKYKNFMNILSKDFPERFKELNLETQTNFIILYDKILNNIENSIDILDLYYSILDFIKEYNKN